MSQHRIARKISVTALAVAAVLGAPGAAYAQVGLVVNAKTFPTPEGAPLARATVATFSDAAEGAPGSFSCRAGAYTATVDWGDGTAVSGGQVVYRYGGEFGICEYAVDAAHLYATAGTYQSVVTVSGRNAQTQRAQGEIIVVRTSAQDNRNATTAEGSITAGGVASESAPGVAYPGPPSVRTVRHRSPAAVRHHRHPKRKHTRPRRSV